jgi:hypothetical protein
MKNKNEIPRRNQLNLNVKVELIIHTAMLEVEKLGSDIRLTNAIDLLQKAKDSISDFIDDTNK